MPTDGAARLDARGYHQIATKRQDTIAEWCGDTRKGEDDWVEGDAITASGAG